MENLTAETFARLPVAVSTNYPLDVTVRRSVDGQVVGSEYRCEVRLDDSPDGTLRTIQVTVSYEQGDETKQVSLESDVFWSR